MGLQDRDYMKERRLFEIQARFRRARAEADAEGARNKPNQPPPPPPPPPPKQRDNGISKIGLVLAMILLGVAMVVPKRRQLEDYFSRGRVEVPAVFSSRENGRTFADHMPFPADGTIKRHVPFDLQEMDSKVRFTGHKADRRTVIRIREWASQTPIATAYMEGVSAVELALPHGDYQITVARGKGWKGDADLFGKATEVYQVSEAFTVLPNTSHLVDFDPVEGNLRTKETLRRAF